ncbi:MAG: transcription termination factor Rho [Prosthecobacter sp.]
MPDEDFPAEEAVAKKTKRKPNTQKAIAKKADVKKSAAKKIAATTKKPAAKKISLKRKAKVTDPQETTPDLAPVENPTPPVAGASAQAAELPATLEPQNISMVVPSAAEALAHAQASMEAAAAHPPQATQPAQPQGQQPQNAHERRKSKFERWKEKQRQRALERQQARLTAQNGGVLPSSDMTGAAAEPPPTKEIELGPPELANGILELHPKGYGNLRQKDRSYSQHPNDCWVSQDLIRQYGMREGMQITGVQRKGPRGPQLTEVNEINVRAPESARDLPLFEELKAINPNKRIQLETHKDRLTTRVIDMFTPVGRGQRGLIVAPPRSGKTTILQHVAEAITSNHPGTHLMILLVDERPEEVTEFKRALPNAEIFASSNDQDVKSHTRIAQFAVERAKRLVECGEHVFMLMDSITRMARAYNNTAKNNATMSGGVGVGALEIPRRLFAAARNTRTAGSLTILATALIETGSKMDDLIFLEFKGTGNMEIVLDRKIAEQFYYPAVNIFKSGTRREELLLQSFQLDKIHMLRRGLAGGKPIDAIQRVLTLLERYPSNAQMLVDLPSKPN